MDKQQFDNHISQMSKKSTGETDFENHWIVIKSICDITKPKNILELGFNRGASAIMWLNASKANLHSIDRRSTNDVQLSIDEINKHYPNRFQYTSLDHAVLESKIDEYKNKYDLVFIDGDHKYSGILRDATNAISLNAPYIAFDDYYHNSHSKDTKKVIKELGLEIIEEYKNYTGQVLTKNPKIQ